MSRLHHSSLIPHPSRFNTPQSLTLALAPRKLADVQGQTAVVTRLKRFAGRPYPAAFLFHGSTGCGKNCTARALAGDLGCVIDGGQLAQQMGGYFDLCGSSLTATEVQARIHGAHYHAMNGSGWKVIVVSEADKLCDTALAVFLHALDYPPPRAVWIFTTNEPDSMDRRFTTRCEPIEFESRADVLEAGANRWLAALWHEAGRNHRAPRVKDFPTAVVGGHLSYRALVLGLQSLL